MFENSRQKSSLELGTAENIWWKSNFKQMCFEVFIKDWYSFRRLIVTGS